MFVYLLLFLCDHSTHPFWQDILQHSEEGQNKLDHQASSSSSSPQSKAQTPMNTVKELTKKIDYKKKELKDAHDGGARHTGRHHSSDERGVQKMLNTAGWTRRSLFTTS